MSRKFFSMIFLLLISLSLITFGCSSISNKIPGKQPKETSPITQNEQDPTPSIEPKESLPKQPIDSGKVTAESDFEKAKIKYYQYFSNHRTRIHPLFSYTGQLDKDTESNLMVFAVHNLDNYSYDGGNSKEEIDEVLLKYFGQTVKNYKTSMTEYVPGTERIRATGWSFHGGLRLVLTKLVPEEDGSFTGSFDVYYISEMYGADDPEEWKNLDSILLSENRDKLSEILSKRAIINFNEITEPGGEFYLKYNTIKVQNMDSLTFMPSVGYDFDERDFDPNTRFAAVEATFNGISISTTKKQLINKLGEPFEIIEDPGEFYLPTTTYVYGGVEYVFEGDQDTVAYIMITHYQWKYGPRNIRIGENFEDVLARFPQEQDYKTHPESCFYGETTYHNEGGAVYLDYEGNVDQIIVVTKEVLPFMKIYFKDNRVSSYVIYGSTT